MLHGATDNERQQQRFNGQQQHVRTDDGDPQKASAQMKMLEKLARRVSAKKLRRAPKAFQHIRQCVVGVAFRVFSFSLSLR